MGAVLAIIQLVLVPILTVLALSIRFAGSARPLNVVDYARVDDPAGLHRWAGRVYLVIGVLVGGLSGLYMAAYAYGGVVAKMAFAGLAVFCLHTGIRAFLAIRAGDVAAHRQ